MCRFSVSMCRFSVSPEKRDQFGMRFTGSSPVKVATATEIGGKYFNWYTLNPLMP